MGLVVDASKLERALQAFVGQTRLQAAQEMRIQARNLAVRLANATQPFGESEAVRQKSEKKIRTEIGRVYMPTWLASSIISRSGKSAGRSPTQTPQQAARAFSSLVLNAGRSTGKRKYRGLADADMLLHRLQVKPLIGSLVSRFDDGDAHRRARYGKNQRVPKNQYVRLIPTNPQAMEKYIRRRQDNVGVAKSGWAVAADKISQLGGIKAGMRGIPPWVRRHAKRYQTGEAADYADARDKPFVELRNTVRYILQVISPDTIRKTIDIQILAMIKRLGIIAAAEAKKAGL
jgi:hypothetical protein